MFTIPYSNDGEGGLEDFDNGEGLRSRQTGISSFSASGSRLTNQRGKELLGCASPKETLGQ